MTTNQRLQFGVINADFTKGNALELLDGATLIAAIKQQPANLAMPKRDGASVHLKTNDFEASLVLGNLAKVSKGLIEAI